MKTLLFSAALLFGSTVFGGEAASLTFDNETYVLASVTVSPDGSVTNDYVKEGETLDTWTTLLTVRHLPQAETINHAINPWLQSVRTQLAKKWSAARSPLPASDADVIVEAWVNTGSLQVEATLYRFASLKGVPGVMAYRFVERLDGSDPGAKDAYAAAKHRRSEELSILKLAAVREKG